jgi:propanol-preferring alcohol dehydrogenase
VTELADVSTVPAKMTAFQLTGWQQPPEYVEVDVPRPGAGEVLLKMAGVGLCHSDFLFMEAPAGTLPYRLPFTLGHENAGWVAALGPGVTGLELGTPVLVAGVHGCGHCPFCLRGHDNYCVDSWQGRGYGEDGGLAPYLAVPRRELVPLSGLDPRRAAPLTDAGATSYHAVKRVLPKLVPGSTAVVIGVGGLGAYAVQYLRLLSPARVVAVDVAAGRLTLAKDLGAHETVLSAGGDAADTVAAVKAAIGGAGAEGVFDFVGTDATMATALGSATTLGAVAIVGAGGGKAQVSWETVPRECDVFIPMAASIADLHEVVALAETGAVRIEVEQFAFDRAAEAYRRFHDGELRSRAVVLPNG